MDNLDNNLIFYRDGNDEKGPFNEQTVLKLYNGAEFTSDVTFQIRSSEEDIGAPFVMLRDLISKNGPFNPFRDEFSDLDEKIAEAEKELAELRAIASKKSELQRKVAEIEKNIEERRLLDSQKGSEPSTTGENTVGNGSLCVCTACNLMLANLKQCLMHVHRSCPEGISNEHKKRFEADIERWEKEDAGRLSMGRRLFSAMNAHDKGIARPQTDFFQDINVNLKKEIKLGTEKDRTSSMQFLESDAAMKLKERLEKHLREAKGKLVCNQCQVACKTHVHFIIHLTTYDHRIKVKGTPFELVSLLLGWFNRALYLKEADPSELDEKIEPDVTSTLDMNSLRVTG